MRRRARDVRSTPNHPRVEGPSKHTETFDIPKDWNVVRFAEAVSIAEGQVDPRRAPYVSMVHVGPDNIEPGTGRLLHCRTAHDLGLISGKYLFRPGDVVYSKIRPYLRKSVHVGFSGLCSADMYPLTIRDGFDARYIHYVTLSNPFTQQAISHQERTGIPKLNREQLNRILILKPPLPEQRAIGAVLLRLQAALEVHDTIVTGLRELKATTIGKVFREGLHGEPLKQTEIGELPDTWSVVALSEVTASSAFGPRFSAALYDPNGNVATLRTTDIDGDGEINYESMPRAGLDAAVFARHLLRPRDLVITRSGTCGIAAVFNEYDSPTIPGAFLIRIRLTPAVSSQFLRLWINSGSGRPHIQRLAKGAVQQNISGTSLATMPIPLPPRDDQEDIVARISFIERAVRAESQRLRLLSSLFSATLQVLMSGQVRVPPNILEEQAIEGPESKPSSGTIDEIVRRIVEVAAPDKIYLFGSDVPGSPSADDGLGLLVVMPFAGTSIGQAIRLEREVKPEFPIELLVRRPEDIDRALEYADSFIKGIIERGRLMYVSPPPPRPRPPRKPIERRTVSDDVLQDVVRRIVEVAAPEKIILFGSAARGEMTRDSDLDFLVVAVTAHPRETAAQIRRRLLDVAVGIPKDVIVVTPEELERHKDTIGYIYRPALREGRVLYAARL